MRRSYISPEYQKQSLNGTFNMTEESNFFGAKMIDIDDKINIDKQDIIYYQKENNEQIDASIETSIMPIVYSPSIDKFNSHLLELDTKQPKYQLDNNTRWILNIDLNSILINYLFATMKKYRTFEGVKNNKTLYNDVNISMIKYIEDNIINKYKYSDIQLFIEYKSLRNQNVLKYDNEWSTLANNKLNRFQTELEFDDSSIKILFNQEKPSSEYKFDYYFNILFEKI